MTGLVLCALIVFLLWLGRRFRATRRRERTEVHEAYVSALYEWLTDPSIIDVAIEQRVMTRPGLAAALQSLPDATEPACRALAASLMKDRQVRRAIAKWMESRGEHKQRAMLQMVDFSEKVRAHGGR